MVNGPRAALGEMIEEFQNNLTELSFERRSTKGADRTRRDAIQNPG
jgi:hypothetical protein